MGPEFKKNLKWKNKYRRMHVYTNVHEALRRGKVHKYSLNIDSFIVLTMRTCVRTWVLSPPEEQKNSKI
jgi:hypothetical protein